jgi:hypothetical protein
VQGEGLSKVREGRKGFVGDLSGLWGRRRLLGDSHNGNNVACYFRKHLKFLIAYASYPGYPFLSLR